MAAKKSAKSTKGKKKLDVDGLLVEMAARFDAVDGKLDSLSSQLAGLSRMVSTERDPAYKTHATLPPKPPIPNDKPRERKMYKAVCAECSQGCEVPFQPKDGRPVYCKACYSKRRNQNQNQNRPANIPNREEIATEIIKTLKLDAGAPSKKKAAKGGKAKKAKKARSKK